MKPLRFAAWAFGLTSLAACWVRVDAQTPSQMLDPEILQELRVCNPEQRPDPNPERTNLCIIGRVTAINEHMIRMWAVLMANESGQPEAIRKLTRAIASTPIVTHKDIFARWIKDPNNQKAAQQSSLFSKYSRGFDIVNLYQEIFQRRMISQKQGSYLCVDSNLELPSACTIRCRLSERVNQGYECLSPADWDKRGPEEEGNLLPDSSESYKGVYPTCIAHMPKQNDFANNPLYQILMGNPRPGESEKTAALRRVYTPILKATNPNGWINALKFTRLRALQERARLFLGTASDSYLNPLPGVCAKSRVLAHYWAVTPNEEESKNMLSRSAKLSNVSALRQIHDAANELGRLLKSYKSLSGSKERESIEKRALVLIASEPLLLGGYQAREGAFAEFAEKPPARLAEWMQANNETAWVQLVEKGEAELGKQFRQSVEESCRGDAEVLFLSQNMHI